MLYYCGMCSEIGCEKPTVARGMCSTHWMRWRRAKGSEFTSRYGDPVQLFWEKVDQRGADECWAWQAHIDTNGYGTYNATHEGVRYTKAHRFSYALEHGEVDESLDLDHTCHDPETCKPPCLHRRCVNPRHLEAVSHRENMARSAQGSLARRTHCDNGHPLSGDNLIIRKGGARRCRECKQARERARYAARLRPEP